MKIFPPEPLIGDFDGFSPELDIFNRAELGAGLTRLVSSVQQPMVIALDADWGTGKTTFLKMWASELRKGGFPVIYFDAFANDYAEDAFISIAGEIIALAKSKSAAAGAKSKRFATSARNAGKVLLRVGAKLIIKGATYGLLDGDEATTATKTLTDASDEATKELDKYLDSLLRSSDQRKAVLQKFRDSLSDLAQELSGDTPTGQSGQPFKPLIFIVDELDRCSPTFALNLLERVKHIFATPNVHFVLGAHLSQLHCSVKAAYGQDIDAKTYLQKFIHVTVPLVDAANHVTDSAVYKYVKHLTAKFEFPSHQDRTVQLAEEFLIDYGRETNLSLRSIERIYTTLALTFSTMNARTFSVAPLILGLSILKLQHPALYLKAKQGRLLYADIEKILLFNRNPRDEGERHDLEWRSGWWRFACDPEASQELLSKHSQGLIGFGVHDRWRLIPLVANTMIDRFVPRP